MPSRIVIIGTGFAGVWSAFSAQRFINIKNKEQDIQVLVISPEPSLTLRPRLYEPNPSTMKQPLGPLFTSAGIGFLQGTVETIDTNSQTVHVKSPSADESDIPYDRLVLAAGSAVVRPKTVSGLEEHAFDIDSIAAATKLESHIKDLASLPVSKARNTVVVCGGGFTGVEIATELPNMLKHIENPRMVLVESAPLVGPELGKGPRPTIMKALESLGVELKLGASITSLDSSGVNLSSGERIESMTVIWTAGVRATSLTQQIPGKKDTLSRLHVDQDLRVPGCPHVFATGDAAHAVTDKKGNVTMPSCQHAVVLGRFSGHNAAADLLGEPTLPYSQPGYGTCLDLGSWGALLANGWDRDVTVTGQIAKQVKRYVNQRVIILPDTAGEALDAADPASYDSESRLKHVLGVLGWTLRNCVGSNKKRLA
ncbi:pyridine nucleotide-disulfide oxidoreductase family protein [Fusarium proliferatum ET1]|uniref:Related to pyridine nucleotide-disulphide oxidoreductase family protein n=1 Tax=Fusarium proliferatum (strain ET1) TaxID=1227346 RepID=A0A1L7W6F4_FUSPR|nr:pyridine nucleotide-disulfide oxidoreductase family protein [Fusarium proliferatum ET1]CZR48092.1 related to pyridine nucleotide-disulphide oxidoreductase family protein [Fusarium proliferatum ET1]